MSALAKQSLPTLSRRQFLRITAAAGTVLLGGRALKQFAAAQHVIRETRLLMGTIINLTVVSGDEAQGHLAVAAAFAEIERLIDIFDWRRPTSAVGALNQSGSLAQPPAALVTILEQATHFGALTGGAFDVTVLPLLEATRRGDVAQAARARTQVDYRRLRVSPRRITLDPGMRVTLDGIAKGWIVDAATTRLQAHGFTNLLVEAGGDLVSRGTREEGQPWRVGITHPRDDARLLDVLALSGKAAATSGDYQHFFSQDFQSHHILDPRSGASPVELASVTVLAPTAMEADALSTAVMVLGSGAGMALIDRLPGLAALLVTKEMQVLRSANLAQ